MIYLKDIHNCQVDESKVLQAYSRDSFILEVLESDNSIKAYKYDDYDKLRNDIKMLNEKSYQVLCG